MALIESIAKPGALFFSLVLLGLILLGLNVEAGGMLSVNAGVDRTIVAYSNTLITGTATDVGGNLGGMTISSTVGVNCTLQGSFSKLNNESGSYPLTINCNQTMVGHSYAITFWAYDVDEATSLDSMVITVVYGTHAPVINAGSDKTILVSTNTVVTATATDVDADIVLMWVGSSAPNGCTFQQGSYSSSTNSLPLTINCNSSTIGNTYEVLFYVMDGTETLSSDTMQFTVVASNTNPNISLDYFTNPIVRINPIHDQSLNFPQCNQSALQ